MLFLLLLLCSDNFRWFVRLCAHFSLLLMHLMLFMLFAQAHSLLYHHPISESIKMDTNTSFISDNLVRVCVYVFVYFFLIPFLFNGCRSCLRSWMSLFFMQTLVDRQNIVLDAAVINNNKFVYFYEINDDLKTFSGELLSIVNVFATFRMFSVIVRSFPMKIWIQISLTVIQLNLQLSFQGRFNIFAACKKRTATYLILFLYNTQTHIFIDFTAYNLKFEV